MSRLKQEVKIKHNGPRMLSDQEVRSLLQRKRYRKSDQRELAAQALMILGLIIVVVVVAVWV